MWASSRIIFIAHDHYTRKMAHKMLYGLIHDATAHKVAITFNWWQAIFSIVYINILGSK